MRNFVGICALVSSFYVSGCTQEIRKEGSETFVLRTDCEIYEFELGRLIARTKVPGDEKNKNGYFTEFYDFNGDKKIDISVKTSEEGKILEISIDRNSKAYEDIIENFRNRIQPGL